MTKPKEWLKANGHITEIGRGRLSRDHIALIEGAVRDGALIEGYEVSKATAETPKPTTVDRVKTDPNRILDVPEEIRAEDAWSAHTYVDGKPVNVGMRTVCNGCGNSLTYCWCRTPVVSHNGADALITFAARTKPFVRTW